MGACYTLEHADCLFCFYDAYDDQSLAWLEAKLRKASRAPLLCRDTSAGGALRRTRRLGAVYQGA